MPSVPRYTKCSHLGCQEERSRYNTYCLTHGGKDTLPTSKHRAEHNSMYQTAYWRNLRTVQLSKHPLCASCLTLGRVTQATHVDHVFPWTQINEEAFYRNIFQSLCHSCWQSHHYAKGYAACSQNQRREILIKSQKSFLTIE